MPIRRLLVANRGEIACRIFRTARRMGIGTAAVYTEADAGAMHVSMADEAVFLGKGSTRGYLDVGRIVKAARSAGADALHPGYGFLSESQKLARRCAAAGILFVGPDARAMGKAGSKTGALAAAAKAGIPTLPGHRIGKEGEAAVRKAAAAIGYPLLVKAVGGGGGRGIRLVRRARDLGAALEQSRSEAKSGFGDDSVFLEKYLTDASHVEVQVMADAHGNVLVAGDRDCSLQRRRQKVIEEAPAPGIGAALRRRLHGDATRLASGLGYTNAGTVEFLVAGDRHYFMEMNARLQVEHPVTEMTVGRDLVEWQLRVAAGERLPDGLFPAPKGHAIEARICAEVPERGFAPAVGRIERMRLPEMPGVRMDAGVGDGDEVTGQFDSLIAKLVVHSPRGRRACLGLFKEALSRLELRGIESNLSFLGALADLPQMAGGKNRIDTLDGSLEALVERSAGNSRRARALACLVRAGAGDSGSAAGFRVNLLRRAALHPSDGHATATAVLEETGPGSWQVDDGLEQPMSVSSLTVGGGCVAARIDGSACRAALRGCGDGEVRLSLGSRLHSFTFESEPPASGAGARSGEDSDGSVGSPMHGVLLSWKVSEGDKVARDDLLGLIEAMKMETEVRSPVSGTVTELCVPEGSNVAAGETIARIEGE